MSEAKPPSSRRARLALLVASSVIALVLADGALRLYEHHYRRVGAIPGGETIDLAAINFNDTVVPRAKPANELRLLSLGDSFAYGIVMPPHSYHASAANYLSRVRGGPVRLVNLGQPGISFPQYRRMAVEWGERLEHDGLVVLVYLGNDLLDVANGDVPRSGSPLSLFAGLDFSVQTGRRRIGIPPEHFRLRLFDYLWALWRVRTATVPPRHADERYNLALAPLSREAWLDDARRQLENFDPRRLERLRTGYESAGGLLDDLSRRIENGRRVVVALAPNRMQIDPTLRSELLSRDPVEDLVLDEDLPASILSALAAARTPPVPVVDLRGPLACGQARIGPMHFETDTHWSAEGHALVGVVLGRWKARHWLDALIASPPASNACAAEPVAPPELIGPSAKAFTRELLGDSADPAR